MVRFDFKRVPSTAGGAITHASAIYQSTGLPPLLSRVLQHHHHESQNGDQSYVNEEIEEENEP